MKKYRVQIEIVNLGQYESAKYYKIQKRLFLNFWVDVSNPLGDKEWIFNTCAEMNELNDEIEKDKVILKDLLLEK